MTSADTERPSAPESGIFVLWSDARPHEQRILSDIAERFQLRRVMRVGWTPERVDENFARFYRGQTGPPYSSVFSEQKGRGPFTVALVTDPAPRYELRDTTRGRAIVNANMLDAKLVFRSWTGGGMRVHGTDTAAEARRDGLLLLGATPSALLETAPDHWDGTIERVDRDLSGADGWPSLGPLFHVLNHAVTYVVLRNFEGLPDGVELGEHADVDLLTDNYHELTRLLNARPMVGGVPRWGGRFLVTVAGTDVIFDLRFVGDDYYDARWEGRILNQRRLADSGIYVPSDGDYFESLAYHAIVHKRHVADDYRDRLARMACALGRDGWARHELDDDRTIAALVDGIVAERGVSYVRPRDFTVFFNYTNVGADHPWLRRKLAGVRREAGQRSSTLLAPVTRAVRVARQQIVARVPWLRELRARTVGRASKAGRTASDSHLVS